MALPYPTPRFGEPLRLAFVGQQTFFEVCSLTERSGRVVTMFHDFRQGADADAMRAALDAFGPHAVVVWRPEIVPAGALDGLHATVIGFLTEPIPRTPGRRAHPDLRRRRADLRGADAGAFDRIVAFDPLIVPVAEHHLPVWRAVPIPVADRLYASVARNGARRPRIGFVGRSTPHRERFLEHPKHELDLLHVAFGLHGAELDAFMRDVDVAVNLHNEPYPSFENRVCLHLAAGHLVVSETLTPTHGLEPGIDYVEISEPLELLGALRTVSRHPDAYHRVRVRGRLKAEQYRASRVWPRLVADCFADLNAFGTSRRGVL